MHVNNVQKKKTLNGINIYMHVTFMFIFFICLCVYDKQSAAGFFLHLCMSCFVRLL